MRLRFLIFSAAILAATSAHADHRQLASKFVQPLIDDGLLVGCVVGIVDGDTREVYGFGETKLGDDRRPDGNTIYEIGSVSKAFTGTLLADMVARGEVELDAPLQDLLPKDVQLQQVPDHPIRLVDVASQSSGLPRMPSNFAPKDPTNPYADYTPKLMFDFLRGLKLTRPPGEYEYSNLGMGLLGYLLAERAGKPYEQLLIERIADPLQMNDTRITLNKEQLARFAPPYNGECTPDHTWDIPTLAGAGGIRSTANDLLKLVAASLDDDVDGNKSNKRTALDAPAANVVAAIHKAWEKQHGKKGEIGVGLGWHIARDDVTRWHNGQTGGYSAAMFIYPPQDLGVVVLTNSGTGHATPLAEKILQSLLGMHTAPLEVRKTVKVPAKVLQTYVGQYALGFFAMFTITLEDGQLWAQLTGQNKYRLFPESETKFFYRVVDAQITFVKDDQGKATKLVLHQNGVDQTAVRVEEE
jgi:D-alanyl-D-alanine-carboxypeptidase/D-alanyl-D-alanine-endopeptidase